MSPEEWQRRKAVFEAVMDAPPGGQQALIAELCAGDEALEEDIRRLVKNTAAPDEFLDGGPATSRELSAGQLLCGRFELLHLAGEGGMGQVWAARDRRLGETVAIKTIQRGLETEKAGLARFQRELQLARRIGHANVCRVYELFEDSTLSPPRVFLTMELLEGETLASRLRREGRLGPVEAIRFFRDVAAGLAAAHGAGVVHRDLKPSNIMLVPEPATGRERAVVMDFGLARAHRVAGLEGEGRTLVTGTGQVMGTPEYMAPEQIRGDEVTPATDVYALGLLLYEMLAGQAPFKGRNTMESWMRRIREGPPKLAVEGMVPGLDVRVDDVIARCMEYEPEARFVSAADAVAALFAPPPRRRDSSRSLRWAAAFACASVLAFLVLIVQRRLQDRAGTPPEDARRWYEDAQRDLSEGATARAAAELRRAIGRAPRFAAAHAALAEAQLELDHMYQARESIQRAADLAPDRSRLPADQALHIEGINRLILRDCAGAIDSLRRRAAAVDAANRPTAMALLARAYERCEMADEARKTLEEAAAADPRNAAVLVRAAYLASRRQDRDGASRLLNEAEALYRERANFEGVGEVLATRGTLAAERDQLEEASTSLREALALARTTGSMQQQVRVLLQQAIVARKRGDVDAAGRLTREGMALASRNDLETLTMQALFTAANVHFRKGELREAETTFSQALLIATRYRDESSQARANASLASLYLGLLEVDKAEATLAACRDHYARSGNAIVLRQLDQVKGTIHLIKAEFPEALALFQRQVDGAVAAKTPEQEADARLRVAEVLGEMGALGEALREARQAVSLLAGSPASRGIFGTLLVAELWARLGNGSESNKALQEARRLIARSGTIPPRVEFRISEVEAVQAWASGRLADSRAYLARAPRISNVRVAGLLYHNMLRCAVEAGSGVAALPTCEAVARTAKQKGHESLVLAAGVYLAEAAALKGDWTKAQSWLNGIRPSAARLSAGELSWKVAAVSFLGGQASERANLARISEALRLNWGDRNFNTWLARPDIARLMSQTLRKR